VRPADIHDLDGIFFRGGGELLMLSGNHILAMPMFDRSAGSMLFTVRCR